MRCEVRRKLFAVPSVLVAVPKRREKKATIRVHYKSSAHRQKRQVEIERRRRRRRESERCLFGSCAPLPPRGGGASCARGPRAIARRLTRRACAARALRLRRRERLRVYAAAAVAPPTRRLWTFDRVLLLSSSRRRSEAALASGAGDKSLN